MPINIEFLGTRIQKLYEFIYHYFDTKEVRLYMIENSDNLFDYIVLNKNKGLYIREEQNNFFINNFELTKDYEIDCYAIDDYEVELGDFIYVINKKDGKNIEMELKLMDRKGEDPDGYNGFISFIQYDVDKDIMLDIQYQQMYREVSKGFAPIFESHTKSIYQIFLDKKYEKKKEFKYGITTSKELYFSRAEYESYTLEYDILAIKEYGLRRFLESGSYNLIKENIATRYSRIRFLDKDDHYYCIMLLGKLLTEEELLDLIRSYGFETSIPKILIELHNGNNDFYNELKNIIQQVKEVDQDPKTDKCIKMELKLQKENN